VFVDDDPLACDALENASKHIDGMTLRSVWGSVAHIAEQCDRFDPHVVLIDLVLPAEAPDGIELANRLRDTHPHLPAIILTSTESGDNALRAWEAGIAGFLTKGQLVSDINVLPDVVRCVLEGGVLYAIDPRSSEAPRRRLSEREVQILRLRAQGLRNVEIAEQLYVAVRTIETHLHNAKGKLGYNRLSDALDSVRRHGIPAPP
jgi:DNA-binding NarL/FixJ family response regulator